MSVPDAYTVHRGITATWYVMHGAEIVSRHCDCEDAFAEAARLSRIKRKRKGKTGDESELVRLRGPR